MNLREEATPRDPVSFSASQKRAAASLLALLQASVVPCTLEASQHPSPGFLPSIDADRPNRVLLIDGLRGVGKTTLMLTVLQQLGDAWRHATVGPRSSPTSRTPERVLLPLDPLDLSQADEETDILMLLVARLNSIVEQLAQDQDRIRLGVHRDRPPDPSARGDGLRERWNELAQAVSGWAGHAKERRRAISAGQFAAELRMESANGMLLAERLRGLLNAVDLRAQATWGVQPQIVLTIDDADVHPERVHELLRIVRAMYAPQLLFLLTGDSDLFLHLMRYTMREQLGPGSENEAMHLARQHYERVIPPGQRVVLTRAGAAEIIDPKTTLGEILHETIWPAPRPDAAIQPRKLIELFQREGGVRFAEVLPGRWRARRDLDLALEALRRAAERRGSATRAVDAHQVIQTIWRAANRRHAPSIRAERLLRRLFRPSASPPWSSDAGLSLEWKLATAKRWSLSSHDLPSAKIDFEIRRCVGLDVRVHDGSTPMGISLDAPLVDGFQMLWDFSTGCGESPWQMLGELPIPDLIVTRVDLPGRVPLEFAWPLPPLRTFKEWDTLFRELRSHLKDHEMTYDEVVRGYVQATYRACRDETWRAEGLPVSMVIEQLHELVKSGDHHHASWARSAVTLVATPMRGAQRGAVGSKSHTGETRREVIADIQRALGASAAEPARVHSRSEVEVVAEQLFQGWSPDWYREAAPRPLQALDQTPLPMGRFLGGVPQVLHGYLATEQRRDLLTAAPPEAVEALSHHLQKVQPKDPEQALREWARVLGQSPQLEFVPSWNSPSTYRVPQVLTPGGPLEVRMRFAELVFPDLRPEQALLELLARIHADYVTDIGALPLHRVPIAALPVPAPIHWWRAFDLIHPGDGGETATTIVRWPCPPLPGFFDGELIGQGSVDVLRTWQRVSSQGAYTLDTLAYWYCSMCETVCKRRSAEFDRDVTLVGPQHWQQRVRILFEEPPPRTGDGWNAWRSWLRALPLFAAPESGLSEEARRCFLDAAREADMLDRELLDRHRHDRVLWLQQGQDAAPDSARTAAWLGSLDGGRSPWE
jgi:hypothetical protein